MAFFSAFREHLAQDGLHDTLHLYYQAAGRRLRHTIDRKRDLKLCGVDLSYTVPSEYLKTTAGATSAQSTPYDALDVVFGKLQFSEQDSLLDVGCAMGRVLAYLVYRRFPGKITGIELNEEVASVARSWTVKFPQITLLCGNAFDLDLNEYNIFYLSNSMEEAVTAQFLEKLERELTHPATVIFVIRVPVKKGRPGWTVLQSGSIYKKWGIPVFKYRQCYAVMRYIPKI